MIRANILVNIYVSAFDSLWILLESPTTYSQFPHLNLFCKESSVDLICFISFACLVRMLSCYQIFVLRISTSTFTTLWSKWLLTRLGAMEVCQWKTTSCKAVITLFYWMICHIYWLTLMCRLYAPYAIYTPTISFLGSLRNTLTIKYTTFQHLPICVLVGLLSHIVLVSMQ